MQLKDYGGFWPLFLVGLAVATVLVLGFGHALTGLIMLAIVEPRLWAGVCCAACHADVAVSVFARVLVGAATAYRLHGAPHLRGRPVHPGHSGGCSR